MAREPYTESRRTPLWGKPFRELIFGKWLFIGIEFDFDLFPIFASFTIEYSVIHLNQLEILWHNIDGGWVLFLYVTSAPAIWCIRARALWRGFGLEDLVQDIGIETHRGQFVDYIFDKLLELSDREGGIDRRQRKAHRLECFVR
jgi:hypothetical protein